MSSKEDEILKDKVKKQDSTDYNYSMKDDGEEPIGRIPVFVGTQDKNESRTAKKKEQDQFSDILHLQRVQEEFMRIQAELHELLQAMRESAGKLQALTTAITEDDVNEMREILTDVYEMDTSGMSNNRVRDEAIAMRGVERLTFEQLTRDINAKVEAFDQLVQENPELNKEDSFSDTIRKEMVALQWEAEANGLDYENAFARISTNRISNDVPALLLKEKISKEYNDVYSGVTNEGLENPFPSVENISEQFNSISAQKNNTEPKSENTEDLVTNGLSSPGPNL